MKTRGQSANEGCEDLRVCPYSALLSGHRTLTSLPIYFFTTSQGDIIILTLCNHLAWLQQTKGLFRGKFGTIIVTMTECMILFFRCNYFCGSCPLHLFIASLYLRSVCGAVYLLQIWYEKIFVNNSV